LRPQYIRIKEEIDAQQILADERGELINAAGLSAMGLKILQEETFFIKC
jgi:hypothetical protein